MASEEQERVRRACIHHIAGLRDQLSLYQSGRKKHMDRNAAGQLFDATPAMIAFLESEIASYEEALREIDLES